MSAAQHTDEPGKVVSLDEVKKASRELVVTTGGHHPVPAEVEPREVRVRALGFDRGKYYFLSDRTHQVLSFTSHTLTTVSGLLDLADLSHWETQFGHPKKGIDLNMAANYLMNQCRVVGGYNPELIRGRGAWWDDGRVIVHVGDYLIVDGNRVECDALESGFIYERGASFGLDANAEPLSNAEAKRFFDLMKLLRWEQDWMATEFAGWIVCAMICGALYHRPHYWLIGGSGAGKSHIENKIIFPSLGFIMLRCQGRTTEAGIRRALKSDARPVWFDEAEAESATAVQRMQGVFDLARAASSEGSPSILKGSMSGSEEAVRFTPRFCIAFSAINPSTRQQADTNRITVGSLRSEHFDDPEARAEQFNKLQAEEVAVLTANFASRLFARAVKLIRVIRYNADNFARAAAEVGGSRRAGDQIGAILAGAAALHTEKQMSLDECRAWLKTHKWVASRILPDPTDRDENRLITTIYQTFLTFRDEKGIVHDRTVGEIVAVASGREIDYSLGADAARSRLKAWGIRVEGETGMVWFAGKHLKMEQLLRGTVWSANWAVPLSRLPGAVKSENAMRFGLGTQCRAVGIPIDEEMLRRPTEDKKPPASTV